MALSGLPRLSANQVVARLAVTPDVGRRAVLARREHLAGRMSGVPTTHAGGQAVPVPIDPAFIRAELAILVPGNVGCRPGQVAQQNASLAGLVRSPASGSNSGASSTVISTCLGRGPGCNRR